MAGYAARQHWEQSRLAKRRVHCSSLACIILETMSALPWQHAALQMGLSGDLMALRHAGRDAIPSEI